VDIADQLTKASELPQRRTSGGKVWALIAAACLFPGLLDACQQYLQGTLSGGATPWQDVLFHGSEWVFLAALTPLVYYLGKRFPPSRRQWKRTILVHLTGAFLLCMGWASLGALLGIVLHRPTAEASLGEAYLSWLLVSLPYSIFMYFTVLGSVYAFTYFIEARDRESQAAHLAAQLSEARLSALRMQLNPHFLFNGLNALLVLVRERKTADAVRMLELLSDLLRQVLNSDRTHYAPLSLELKFVEQCLEVEQIRFPDRLRVRWSIDEFARRAIVPSLILQPLVENALHHGIAKRASSGELEIVGWVAGSNLVLAVRDDGAGFAPKPAGNGVGLCNTRERLATLYGDKASLRVTSLPDRGTEALLIIPYATEGSLS
jgi:two-component system LytT family sensor kinase